MLVWLRRGNTRNFRYHYLMDIQELLVHQLSRKFHLNLEIYKVFHRNKIKV